MLELFAKGGVVMAILFMLSIYVSAVVLFKIYQFWKLQVNNPEFSSETSRLVKIRSWDELMLTANSSITPLARVIESALHCRANDDLDKSAKEEELGLSGSNEIRKLEGHLKGLEMVANIAPLLGLLGTVLGMVKAFATLQQAGTQVDPSLLAGGIWEALLTTIAGLSVAIPALAAHYILDGSIEKFRHKVEEVTTRILAAPATLPASSGLAAAA